MTPRALHCKICEENEATRAEILYTTPCGPLVHRVGVLMCEPCFKTLEAAHLTRALPIYTQATMGV